MIDKVRISLVAFLILAGALLATPAEAGNRASSNSDNTQSFPVVVYGRKPGCPRTMQTLQYLAARQVKVEFHDVDKEPSVIPIVMRYIGEDGLLPVILIDSKPVPYDADEIDSALINALERQKQRKKVSQGRRHEPRGQTKQPIPAQ